MGLGDAPSGMIHIIVGGKDITRTYITSGKALAPGQNEIALRISCYKFNHHPRTDKIPAGQNLEAGHCHGSALQAAGGEGRPGDEMPVWCEACVEELQGTAYQCPGLLPKARGLVRKVLPVGLPLAWQNGVEGPWLKGSGFIVATP